MAANESSTFTFCFNLEMRRNSAISGALLPYRRLIPVRYRRLQSGRVTMLRELVTASAIGLFMVGGAYAQSSTEVPTTTVPATPATPEPVQMVKKAEGHLATDLLGRTVYNGTSEESEAIGDVNDFTVGPDGQIQAIVIGVGGFLGLGEKNVAIEYGLVKFEDRNDSEVLVVETTAEKLDALEPFEEAAYRPVPADESVNETRPATAEDLNNAPVEKAPEELIDSEADRNVTPAN